MSLRVFWSDRLETMADKMLDEWASRPSGDPFARTCVAVGDMATRNWIKDRFLLHRAPGVRRVLANVDFKPLPELANDWLAAAVHGREVAEGRNPAEHPFSKGVMAWRIDAILREEADDPAFKVLADYIAAGGGQATDRRRFDLATRLAQMFDDYLVTRAPMMYAWERGRIPDGGDERWQALLYRELAKNAGSYAADYAEALAPDFDPERAFANGFPRYAAVHVFDVIDAPQPYLEMLKRISETTPVTFWTFNPSRDFWMGNPTKSQALREKAARLRQALENGENPPEEAPEEPDLSTPDARLLGALATGARGLIENELDLAEGNREWLGDKNAEDFASLRAASTEIHVCHSPRRELEAARDALHRFFQENADAKPSDALVLCADWQTYSPLVEAVFGGKDGAGLPFATSGMASASPVEHSFGELLDFRTNRFGASAVFSLLGIPEIRDRFDLSSDDVAVLRDLVKKGNIHWGFDDEDVRNILGQEAKPEKERNRFTWQRGLDRLTLDALLGPREDEDALYEAGALGRLLPGGHVESERADAVGGLFRFTKRLMRLRRFLQSPRTAEEWRDGLLEAVDDFYKAGDAALGVVLGLRRAIETAAAAAVRARETDGRTPGRIPGEVFCRAVLDAVRNGVRKFSSAGDAVRVAPLSNGSAVPARFVWVCGLNDGSFPRNEYRPTFDLVGRRPTMYDVTPRERDALALLKAALGARDRLCLSYVGRDIRTNEKIPPAVPLTDLLEWFRASGVAVAAYAHPLQSYSERYFREPGLPRAFSPANRAAAQALAEARAAGAAGETALTQVVPFPLREDGETIIELDDLAEFCAQPNRFLAGKRLGIRFDSPGFARLDDEDRLEGALPSRLTDGILVRGQDAVSGAPDLAEALAESGVSLPEGSIADLIEAEIDNTGAWRNRVLSYKKDEADGFQCDDRTAAQALADWQDGAAASPFHVDFEIDGHGVSVVGIRRTIPLPVRPSGRMDHVFVFSHKPVLYESAKVAAWIRHIAGHAAGGRFVTAMMCRKVEPARTYRPMPREEAKRILEGILSLVSGPVAFDIRKASDPREDALSGALADAVGGYAERIVSTQQPRGKRK